jgi:hypothetical protein
MHFAMLITKFIISNLFINLITIFCFLKCNVTVLALFEEARELMSGKVIRLGVLNVSKYVCMSIIHCSSLKKYFTHSIRLLWLLRRTLMEP